MRRNESAGRAAGKAKAKATREKKKTLAALSVADLRKRAKDAMVSGYSSMTKAEIVKAIVVAESGKEKKRQTYSLGEAKERLARGRKQKLQGRGPFRLVLVKDGAVYADMGPYAAARGAQADAKTLLRRVVGDTHKLSHEAAIEAIDSDPTMDKAMGGKVVDGWIAIIKDEDEAMGAEEIDAQAWVVKHDRKDKNALAKATIPAALRNNGRKASTSRLDYAALASEAGAAGDYVTAGLAMLAGGRSRDRLPEHLQAALKAHGYGRVQEAGAQKALRSLATSGGSRSNGRKARGNGAASTVDPDAVRELVMYAENDGRLYERLAQPIMLNLARKLAAGKFDRALAVKGMVPLADEAAKGYTKEFGTGSGFGIFSAATRRAAAADLLAGYMEEIEGKAAMLGGKRTGRRNPIVSFQTKNGPVSFTAKKTKTAKRNPGLTSARILRAFPAARKNTDDSITIGRFVVFYDDADRDNPGWVVRRPNGDHEPVDTVEHIAYVVGA